MRQGHQGGLHPAPQPYFAKRPRPYGVPASRFELNRGRPRYTRGGRSRHASPAAARGNLRPRRASRFVRQPGGQRQSAFSAGGVPQGEQVGGVVVLPGKTVSILDGVFDQCDLAHKTFNSSGNFAITGIPWNASVDVSAAHRCR